MVTKKYFNNRRLAVFILWFFMAITALPGSLLPDSSQEKDVQLEVLPFELGRVKLLQSPFTENRDKTLAYLKFLDTDRMLHNFRIAAGIPSKAQPLGGWEQPDCKLRGHSLGHFLSALAQAYASTSDPVFSKKIHIIVSELARCQNRLMEKGYPTGFLSAYSPDQFNLLEKLTLYPEIWAPYYTLHKILAGLIAAHELAGNRKALEVAEKTAGWVVRQLEPVPESRLQEMWNLYIAGEYGGMNEVLAELYRISGKKEYLVAARKFDKTMLLQPLSRNKDKLAGLHANQHIPQITGYLRIFDMTGNKYYLNAAKNFWKMAAGHHMYINGGVSEGEMFKDPDKFASYITEKTCETCCAYNLLKLTRQLYCHDPRPEYADYTERALYNQILASQDPKAQHTSVTYFMPLNPGGKKDYSDDYHHFTCCHGTGMENHTKYQEFIYFRSRDGQILYVNLYLPSVLNWPERGIRIIQEQRFAVSEASSFTIKGSGRLKIKFRIPYWARQGFSLTVNRQPQSTETKRKNFAILDREWKNNDKVTIRLPLKLRLERLPDIPDIAGIMAGPFLLVGLSNQKDWIHLNLDPGNLDKVIKRTDDPLVYSIGNMILVPMFRAHHRPYHAYFIIVNANNNHIGEKGDGLLKY